MEYIIIAIGFLVCVITVLWLCADLGGECHMEDNQELYKKG